MTKTTGLFIKKTVLCGKWDKPESFLRYAQIAGNKQERDSILTTIELKDHFTVDEIAEVNDSLSLNESPGIESKKIFQVNLTRGKDHSYEKE